MKSRNLAPSELIDPQDPHQPQPPITISIANQRVVESAGNVSVDVALSRTSADPVQVLAHSRPISVTPGQDFYGFSRLSNFPPGQSKVSFSAIILNDDNREPSEIFEVRLLNAIGADIQNSAAIITIEDDD